MSLCGMEGDTSQITKGQWVHLSLTELFLLEGMSSEITCFVNVYSDYREIYGEHCDLWGIRQ